MSTAPTWDDVKTWADAAIERARTDLEQPGNPEPLRARIAALRDVLALGTKPPPPEIPPAVGY